MDPMTINTAEDKGEGTGSTAAPEGHDAKMAEAFDNAQTPPTEETAEKPPEKILGKFDTQEELVSAYEELSKKLGEGGKAAEESEGEDAATTDDEAQKAVESAGLDMGALSNEYAQNGALADASYEALEKAGIPRETVDSYIQGQEALADQQKTEVLSDVGGEEKYSEMVQWAASEMSDAEIDQYNSLMNSGDLATIRNTVQSLAYRYQQANPQGPNLVKGGAPNEGARFSSVAELTTAMSDPKYSTDPAFRAQVQQKLERSSIM